MAIEKHLQSLLFLKSWWTPEKAAAWCSRHGYGATMSEEGHSARFWHFRQQPPHFSRYVNLKLYHTTSMTASGRKQRKWTGIEKVLGYGHLKAPA